jgi:outer membrane protein assembly factor BamB
MRYRIAALALLAMLLVSACVGGPIEPSWGRLSVVGDQPTIFLAFSDRLVQLDPTDGAVVKLRDSNGQVRVDEQGNPRPWEVINQAGGGPAAGFYSSPIVIDEDSLLVAMYDRKLLEIDAPAARVINPTGIELPGGVVTDMLMTDALLYVPMADNDLVAYNPADLSVVWTFETDHGVWAKPLLVDNTLYFTSLDHLLYAVDAATGAEQWRIDLEGAVAGTPTYANGNLYIGSFAGKIFKISTGGEIVASYDTQGWVWGAPAVVDGVVYAADLDGYVYALNDAGSSFTEVWAPRQVAARAIRATPLIIDDKIIVGSRDLHVYWLSRSSGEEIFNREMRGEVMSDMLVLEPSESLNIPERLLIVSTIAREELVVAFTLENGERRWVYGR